MDRLKGIEAKWLAAFISCLLMMVQGDITAVDIPHWINAAKTATAASLIFAAMVFVPKAKEIASQRLGGALSFGGGVFVSDLWVHPTHFMFPTAEAITTALMSAALAYVAHDYITKS
jgi:hypothetical protein